MPILREMGKTDTKAHMRGDGIFAGGRLYRNVRDLPIDIHAAVTKTMKGVTVFRGGFSMQSDATATSPPQAPALLPVSILSSV